MLIHLFFFEAFGAKEYVAVAVGVISLGTLIKGIVEYTKAQQWKKAEFLSKEVKEFYGAPVVVRALKIVDLDDASFPVYKEELNGKDFLKFDNELVLAALRFHGDVPEGYPKEQAIIREVFDGLLDKLSLFQHYIEAGLFSANELKGYLKYWTDIMFDEANDRKVKDDFRKALKQYIYAYKFYDLVKLVKALGYNFS